MKKVYGGYIKSADKLSVSTSGGAAAAFAVHTILNHGIVFGVEYTSDFYSAKYRLVDRLEDLKYITGTKYVMPSLKVDKLNCKYRLPIDLEGKSVFQIVQFILNNMEIPVLFIGLPCVAAALNKFLGDKSKNNLIIIELICHGPMSGEIHKAYLKSLEKKFDSSISYFNIRYKRENWLEPYILVKFKNGRTLEKKYRNSKYSYIFSIAGNNRCYDCKFKGDNSTGDIMIGDFWGATDDDDFYNVNGTSVVIVKSDKGLVFLESCRDQIVLYETSYERAIKKNPMILKSRNIHDKKDIFEQAFKNTGFDSAVKAADYNKYLIKSMIKKIINRFR